MAKATSRASDPSADWNAWCIDQWRTFIKGDTFTGRDGVANKDSSIPGFVDRLYAMPAFGGWTRDQVDTWVRDVFQKTGHRFDA